MEDIIEKFKEIIILKNNKCNYQCNNCPLHTVVKEIWYDYGYEEIDICDFIRLIEDKIIN